jgi:RecB family exonuclease
MRTSYSALDTFKTCPLKYKFQEIDKIKAPKNIESVFGGTVHSTLKYMFEKSPLFPTPDQVIDFFRNLWDKNKTLLSNPPEQLDSFYKDGISMLEKFYKHNQPWNFNVVELESRFAVDLENHTLAGIIDRIDKNDETYEIIDYKTAKKMPGKDIVDRDLQISIYHLGLTKRWPHLDPAKIKLSFYFLKHGEKISTSRTMEQLGKTEKLILKTIEEIDEKIKDNYNFPPLPSGLCDWCGYRQMCPMWKHLYESRFAKVDSDQIKKIIKEYFGLKDQNQKNNERLNELRMFIQGFMDEQKVERVFGEEGYLTKKTQERFIYNMEKIKEILEEIGKWNEVVSKKQFTTLTVSKKKTKDLI